MLAAIISLLQDDVQPQPRPRTQVIDLGSGGGINVPMYDVVDYIDVLSSFRESPGESPVLRAVRRAQHLRQGLPAAWRAREERDTTLMARGMLIGVELERRRAEEAARDLAAQEIVTQILAAELRGQAEATTRRATTNGTALAVVGIGLGVALMIGVMRKATR